MQKPTSRKSIASYCWSHLQSVSQAPNPIRILLPKRTCHFSWKPEVFGQDQLHGDVHWKLKHETVHGHTLVIHVASTWVLDPRVIILGQENYSEDLWQKSSWILVDIGKSVRRVVRSCVELNWIKACLWRAATDSIEGTIKIKCSPWKQSRDHCWNTSHNPFPAEPKHL